MPELRRTDVQLDAVRLGEDLVAALRKPDRLHALMQVLERRGFRDTWLATSDGTVVQCGQPPAPALINASWQRLTHDTTGSRIFASSSNLVLPIVGGDQLEAVLGTTLYDGLDATGARALAGPVVPCLALELANQRALQDTGGRYVAELVDLAMGGGGPEAARARLLALELEPTRPLMALLVGDDPERRSYPKRIETVLSEVGIRAVVAPRRQCLVVVAQPLDGADAIELGRRVADRVGGCPIGVGSIVPGVDGLRRTLIEADYAYRVACSRPKNQQLATYYDIRAHSLLLDLHDDDVVRSFCLAVLQPLRDHDRSSHVQLVDTVDAFLRSGGQWQVTARELSVHVNTLRHRMGRVEALTGRDLSSTADRVDLFVALTGIARLAEHDSAAI